MFVFGRRVSTRLKFIEVFVYADVAEQANASDLSSDGLCALWVQIPSSVPKGNAELKLVVGRVKRLGWVRLYKKTLKGDN